MVYNGTTSRTLSLADGHLSLSTDAAALCGYHPSTFASQRKLVLAYWAARQQGPLAFSLCNSGHFMQNMWLLTCPRSLETRDGSDAPHERCTCQLPQGLHPCATSDFGLMATTDTRPGYW